MLISNNNYNNIKGISSIELIEYGNGDKTSWLRQNNNWLCKFAYARVKQGDTFIAWGNGGMWKVNNKVYGWFSNGANYQIVDITGNNYSYEVVGKYSVWRVK